MYHTTIEITTTVLLYAYAAITPLKHLAEQYHLSILLIHHLRKNGASDPMDEVSGSTGLTGATDCNMVLQRERGQNNASLHITGRDVEDQVLKIIFDPLAGPTSSDRPRPPRSHDERCDRMVKSRDIPSTEIWSESSQWRVLLFDTTCPIVPPREPRCYLPFALSLVGRTHYARHLVAATCHLAKLLCYHRLRCCDADRLNVCGDHVDCKSESAHSVAG